MLAVVGLGEVEVLEVEADSLRVDWVEGMLGVYKRGQSSRFLGFGDDMKSEGGLAAGFGTVDLNDAAHGHATDP